MRSETHLNHIHCPEKPSQGPPGYLQKNNKTFISLHIVMKTIPKYLVELLCLPWEFQMPLGPRYIFVGLELWEWKRFVVFYFLFFNQG